MSSNKTKSAFRNISEVTEELDIAPHVLRFWETKFQQLKPMKTKSARRYYRPDDVAMLKLIKELLYERRYTIEGVQKLFKNRSQKDILGTEIQQDFFEISNNETIAEVSEDIKTVISKLKQIKTDLELLAEA